MASGLPWVSCLLLLATALPLAPARSPWTKASTACHVVATGSGGRFRSFLWRRPGGAPPVVVQGAWDARGRLLECAWRAVPALTASSGDSCDSPHGPLERALWGPELRRDLDALAERQDSCWGAERLGQPGGGRVEPADPGAGGRKRARRGWTMPGTLWCGAGNSAGDFTELGVFQGPDVCCREHDQCEAQIDALEYKYGMRNYRLHTISHCDCDAQFRQCLMTLNDTISNFIGISFFNLLEVPCFVLEESEECVEWDWWSGCMRYGPVPLARLVQQSQYRNDLPLEEKSDHATSPSPPPPPPPSSPPPHPGRHRVQGQKLAQKNHWKHPAQEATERQRLHPEHNKGQDLVTPQVPFSRPDLTTSSQAPRSPGTTPITWGAVSLWPALGGTAEAGLSTTGATSLMEHPDIQPDLTTSSQAPRSPGTTPLTWGAVSLWPALGGTAEAGLSTTGATSLKEHPDIQQARPKEAEQPSEVEQAGKPLLVTSKHRHTAVPSSPAPSRSCNCYRRLDQCPYRIAPNEVKYQLHNLDSRTLFHCNCTRRLARFLRKTKGPNEVEEEVLADYVSSSCFLLQVPPGCTEGEEEHPNCIDVGRAILAPARHLTNRLTRKQPGASSKTKRHEWTPPGRPVQLYEKCMQLAQATHPTRPPH